MNASTKGMSLAEAASKFAKDARAGRMWYAAYLIYKRSDARVPPDELVEGWVDLEENIHHAIEGGTLRLGGYQGDEVTLTWPDAGWIANAVLNPWLDTLREGDLTLRHVKLFSHQNGKPTAQHKPIPAKQSKGTAQATLFAIQAIAATVHVDGAEPRRAANLAARAAAKAQELGLPGADALNPSGSSMREIARAFLDGIEAADRA